MSNYTEEAKQIYNKVCDKYKHHWLDTTVSQTMAMEMITEALSIAIDKTVEERAEEEYPLIAAEGFGGANAIIMRQREAYIKGATDNQKQIR